MAWRAIGGSVSGSGRVALELDARDPADDRGAQRDDHDLVAERRAIELLVPGLEAAVELGRRVLGQQVDRDLVRLLLVAQMGRALAFDRLDRGLVLEALDDVALELLEQGSRPPRGSRRRAAAISEREREWRMSAVTMPNAENTLGTFGSMTSGMPISCATATACWPPAPPKAHKVKSRGSRPRSTVTCRTAAAMLALTIR